METTEVWKRIRMKKGWLGEVEFDYFVSTLGRVKNLKGKILKPYPRGNHKGVYLCVALYRNGERTIIDVQRLVAMHFLPNPHQKPEVNHLNLNHFDNRLINLEWCTRQENVAHRFFMEAHSDLSPRMAV